MRHEVEMSLALHASFTCCVHGWSTWRGVPDGWAFSWGGGRGGLAVQIREVAQLEHRVRLDVAAFRFLSVAASSRLSVLSFLLRARSLCSSSTRPWQHAPSLALAVAFQSKTGGACLSRSCGSRVQGVVDSGGWGTELIQLFVCDVGEKGVGEKLSGAADCGAVSTDSAF
eukprot:5152965-Pleurochrysis_carterae.AAC.1